jgi:hypothetical protein
MKATSGKAMKLRRRYEREISSLAQRQEVVGTYQSLEIGLN